MGASALFLVFFTPSPLQRALIQALFVAWKCNIRHKIQESLASASNTHFCSLVLSLHLPCEQGPSLPKDTLSLLPSSAATA